MKNAAYGWLPGKENYRPIRTLFDCAIFKINLKADCWQCQHVAVLDAPGHWWRCKRLGLDDSVRAFHARLYCSLCFKREKIRVREPKLQQTWENVTGALLPGPDEYTWKQIINRQRG